MKKIPFPLLLMLVLASLANVSLASPPVGLFALLAGKQIPSSDSSLAAQTTQIYTNVFTSPTKINATTGTGAVTVVNSGTSALYVSNISDANPSNAFLVIQPGTTGYAYCTGNLYLWAQSVGGKASVTVYTKLVAKDYDVNSFGATGNGTTDDTAAINAALTAAASTGGIVNLRAATYKVSASLIVPTHVKLVGSEKGASVLQLASSLTAGYAIVESSSFHTLTGTTGTGVNHGGIENVTIDGGNADGNTTAIVARGVNWFGNSCYFHNVVIRNCSSFGLWAECANPSTANAPDQVENVFDSIKVHDNGDTGIVNAAHDSKWFHEVIYNNGTASTTGPNLCAGFLNANEYAPYSSIAVNSSGGLAGISCQGSQYGNLVQVISQIGPSNSYSSDMEGVLGYAVVNSSGVITAVYPDASCTSISMHSASSIPCKVLSGSGSGASITMSTSSSGVPSWTISSGGTGYPQSPYATFSSSGTITTAPVAYPYIFGGSITGWYIANAGNFTGYLTMSINAGASSGTGAYGVPVVSGTAITGINMGTVGLFANGPGTASSYSISGGTGTITASYNTIGEVVSWATTGFTSGLSGSNYNGGTTTYVTATTPTGNTGGGAQLSDFHIYGSQHNVGLRASADVFASDLEIEGASWANVLVESYASKIKSSDIYDAGGSITSFTGPGGATNLVTQNCIGIQFGGRSNTPADFQGTAIDFTGMHGGAFKIVSSNGAISLEDIKAKVEGGLAWGVSGALAGDSYRVTTFGYVASGSPQYAPVRALSVDKSYRYAIRDMPGTSSSHSANIGENWTLNGTQLFYINPQGSVGFLGLPFQTYMDTSYSYQNGGYDKYGHDLDAVYYTNFNNISGGSAPTNITSVTPLASSATDSVGSITIVVGSSVSAAATIATPAFKSSFGTTPRFIQFSAGNSTAAAVVLPYCTPANLTTSGFTISAGGTMAAGTYVYYYHVIQ